MSLGNPLISFVVPSYNYGAYLEECVNSILTQSSDYPLEVVIIDDASTDDSRSIIENMQDPRIRKYYHEKNQGHVITINEGFSYAKGKYIARIDSDDSYRPTYLELTIPILEKHPHVGLVHGQVALVDKDSNITLETNGNVGRVKLGGGNEFIPVLAKNYICAPTVIAKAELWRQALPIPEGVSFSDWYLNIEMARRADFYYVDEVLANYRVHSQNLHSVISKDKTEEHTVFEILDRIFQEKEENESLQVYKEMSKNFVYAEQYFDLAEKYFGFFYSEDAKRCYEACFKHDWKRMINPKTFLHYVGSLIGRNRYENIKALFK